MGISRKRRFKDNDVIRIPAYSQRVTVEGAVKRPGIFEMKPGESFNLLSFASGFTEFAIQPQ
jgi:protein involved in polysaccharide export with SLBB domain